MKKIKNYPTFMTIMIASILLKQDQKIIFTIKILIRISVLHQKYKINRIINTLTKTMDRKISHRGNLVLMIFLILKLSLKKNNLELCILLLRKINYSLRSPRFQRRSLQIHLIKEFQEGLLLLKSIEAVLVSLAAPLIKIFKKRQ